MSEHLNRAERRTRYADLYQQIGALAATVPEPIAVRTDGPDAEEAMRDALDNGLTAIMDVLVALVDVTEDDAE